MADTPISLTCADYARVMPLATGDVKSEGIALTLIHGTGGPWEMRADAPRERRDQARQRWVRVAFGYCAARAPSAASRCCASRTVAFCSAEGFRQKSNWAV